jgi:Bacterial Ig-like domain (group 1)
MKATCWRAACAALIGIALSSDARANDVFLFDTVFGTDMRIEGVGGLRNVGEGVIVLTGVTGPVRKAYLFWQGPTSSGDPSANANVEVNGVPVAGTNIGFSSDNCWGYRNSQAYRADVTGLVTGDGEYVLSGLGYSTTSNTNGASLVVFYDDGDPTNDRDVALFIGNDSNIPNEFDANGWNVTLSGIRYGGGTAAITMNVSDGQAFPDAALILNGRVLVAAGPVFEGDTVPSANNGPGNNGSLWDIRSFDVTSFLSPGPNTLSLTTGVLSDCLSLVAALVDLPAGAAPGEHLSLAPATATTCTEVSGTVTVTITDSAGAPIQGRALTFEVVSGPGSPLSTNATTDAQGRATLTYRNATGTAGLDDLRACISTVSGAPHCAKATNEWLVCNRPPDVTNAHATRACIWPPNHKFVPVGIAGVSDPDGDPVSVRITGVTSDEATATERGAGGIRHAPDARNLASTVDLRAERSGLGDGRVYQISFLADDGHGGTTTGKVTARVPHDEPLNGVCQAVDSGQQIDATQ